MKAYTDIEQSRKLAEIIPPDGADMSWIYNSLENKYTESLCPAKELKAYYDRSIYEWDRFYELTPCWSLAALLDYLSANFRIDIKYLDNQWELDCRVQVTYARELVDTCYEMIIELHEQNIL